MLFCRRHSIWSLILVILGIRLIRKEKSWTDEERKTYRAKRRLFRSKMRDAFAVWGDEEEEAPTSQEN